MRVIDRYRLSYDLDYAENGTTTSGDGTREVPTDRASLPGRSGAPGERDGGDSTPCEVGAKSN